MATAIHRPDVTEYSPYFARYIERVPEGDIVAELRESGTTVDATLAALDETRGAHRPDPAKWSISQIVGHLIDVERVFVFRALHIARGNPAPLPSFEQDEYAAAAGSDARQLSDLREELRLLRAGTIRFFATLPASAWTLIGVAGGNNLSVRAIAHIIVGHTRHHLQVLVERYDVPTLR
jgi:DinB superfamily